MKFGAVPLARAEGAILAHSLPTADGRIRKGRLLDRDDIAALAAAGHDEIVVARLTDADVHEDQAAAALARALVPYPDRQGLRLSEATTGRVNLFAAYPGALEFQTRRIARINMVDPGITLATLDHYAGVTEGQLVGTVKIISYGVAATALNRAVTVAESALRLRRVVTGGATLILTGEEAATEKSIGAVSGRLDRLGIALDRTVVVPHKTAPLAEAIAAATSDLILLLTSTATSDARDVGPEALRLAGGALRRYGIPVDPGNLLFYGDRAGRPVIGLPGCARSPLPNGADWILTRLVVGHAPADEEIAEMGAGGLLKEPPSRPSRRTRARDPAAPPKITSPTDRSS